MRRMLLVAFLLVPAPVQAAVSYVDNLAQCAGLLPCYSTIMVAVETAMPPATIEVFPGVYHEAVAFFFKGGIELRSRGAGSHPVIVAPALTPAVHIINSPDVLLSGFIVEAPQGVGVAVSGGGSSSVILEDNYIRSRWGVFFNSVTGCVARDNTIEGGRLDMGGSGGCVPEGNTVRGSIMINGGLPVGLLGAYGNIVESNLVIDGSIRLVLFRGQDNLIRDNVVRGGGIEVGHGAAHNTIEDNFVSGSPGDGIRANSYGDYGYANNGGGNIIRGNTSVENAGCDLSDISEPSTSYPNAWSDNRYGTSCGTASQSCPTPATWYRDADGDGYGTADDRQEACSQPAGFEGGPGDCDDANPSIHPGASEDCDGRDDDCNGGIDDDPSATASCDDGNACTIDACRAGACATSPAIIPQATCTASPEVLNLDSNGKPFGLTVALTDRCSGRALDPMGLTPLFVSAVNAPALGQVILPTPNSDPGCTQDGIWETVSHRDGVDADTMTTHFQAPSDGLCTTLDGNRQDIIRLLGNGPDGGKADISFAAGYPGAADSMRCAASVVIRRAAVNQAEGVVSRR
jgi:hypothetical protein